MDARRWEDMDADCLVNIFQRLGLDDLAIAMPFVCKAWSRISSDPLCWKVLDFRALDFMPWSRFSKRITNQYLLPTFSFSSFMKFSIQRSRKSAVEVRFPLLVDPSYEDLVYVSNECPSLRTVVLSRLMPEVEEHIPGIIGKWKDLERLKMECKPSSFLEMITQISINSKSFSSLRMYGSIKKEDALAIVKFLPKLKHLDLSKSYLPKEELLIIVDGCKELEKIIATDCFGFQGDDEVLKMVSHVKTFEHDGSKLLCDDGYMTDESDCFYIPVIPKNKDTYSAIFIIRR